MAEDHTPPRRPLAVPRPWTVLALGALHEHAVVAIVLVASAPIVVLIVADPDTLPDWVQLVLVGLALALISGYGRHLVLAPLTRLLKRRLTGTFRILYFRSFATDRSHAARDHLGPILGCVGTLTTVHDPGYIQGLTPTEGHSHDEQSWLAWLEIGEVLSDALTAPRFTAETWRAGVLELLQSSDLVAIDVTGASDNVAWELTRAREALPPERVIVLRAEGDEPGVAADGALVYETSPRGRWRLRRALARRLRAIATTGS